MLTFEKVLEVFDDILRQDPLYEVVKTSHGYTLMGWEPERNEWGYVEWMETPEMLSDALIRNYAGFLEDEITESDRELTAEERAEIDAKCKRLMTSCQEA